MKELKKSGIALTLLVLLCALVLTGCDGLGGGSNDSDSVIKIESVEFDGDNATIVYEDGYTVELTDICASAVLYQSDVEYVFVTTPSSKPEADAEETVFDEPVSVQESVEEAVGTSEPYDGTYFDTMEFDTVSKDTWSSILTGGAMGARVIGTLENPIAGASGGSFVVQSGSGQMIVAGNGSSVSSGNMVSVVSYYTSTDGKKYEFYESRLKDHVAENLKVATVLANGGGYEKEVTVILAGGFSQLYNLEQVTLPASITEIKSAAFYQCQSLTTINFLGTVEQWNAIQKGENWDLETGNYTVHCTDGDVVKE